MKTDHFFFRLLSGLSEACFEAVGRPPEEAAHYRFEAVQARLSREAGIARSTISEVLAGKKPFSRRMVRKLADYFEVDVGMAASNW